MTRATARRRTHAQLESAARHLAGQLLGVCESNYKAHTVARIVFLYADESETPAARTVVELIENGLRTCPESFRKSVAVELAILRATAASE